MAAFPRIRARTDRRGQLRYWLAGGIFALGLLIFFLSGPVTRYLVMYMMEDMRMVLGGAADRIAFTPDGTTLMMDDMVHWRLWDLETGEEYGCIHGSTGGNSWLTLDPDGTPLAAVIYDDKSTLIIDTFMHQVVHVLNGHDRKVESLAFSPDGTRLATGSQDLTARIWDVKTGEELHVLSGHTGFIRQVHFSPDGEMLLTAGEYDSTRLWDTNTGELLHVIATHERQVWDAGFIGGGSRAFVIPSGADGPVVWDVQKSERMPAFETKGQSVYFSPDGTRVLTAGRVLVAEKPSVPHRPEDYQNVSTLWNIETGEEALTLQDRMPRVTWTMIVDRTAEVFSPGGKVFHVARGDDTLELRDSKTGDLLHTFSIRGANTDAVHFTPDGTGLLLASTREGIVLWDIETGEKIRRFLDGQPPIVEDGKERYYSTAAAFSPDGSLLAASAPGRMAWVWDVETGQVLHEFSLAPDRQERFRYALWGE